MPREVIQPYLIRRPRTFQLVERAEYTYLRQKHYKEIQVEVWKDILRAWYPQNILLILYDQRFSPDCPVNVDRLLFVLGKLKVFADTIVLNPTSWLHFGNIWLKYLQSRIFQYKIIVFVTRGQVPVDFKQFVGDLLADQVDSGNVVIHLKFEADANQHLGGRWCKDKYLPIPVATSSVLSSTDVKKVVIKRFDDLVVTAKLTGDRPLAATMKIKKGLVIHLNLWLAQDYQDFAVFKTGGSEDIRDAIEQAKNFLLKKYY